jgi:hypothetical protein
MFRAQLSELNEEQRERVDSEMQRVMDRFMGRIQVTGAIMFCLHCEMAVGHGSVHGWKSDDQLYFVLFAL